MTYIFAFKSVVSTTKFKKLKLISKLNFNFESILNDGKTLKNQHKIKIRITNTNRNAVDE